MIKTINVPLEKNSYQIIIGNKILPLLGSKLKALRIGHDAIIITNPIVNKIYSKSIVKGLKNNGFTTRVFVVPDGEKSKSVKTAFQLIEKIAKYDIYKRPFVIALGGGVIGDLAGFIASIYKRGIPFVQVPTTFLGQIDSAIGGKVAVDLDCGKNMVGSFYQPKIVWSDVAVLSTISPRQVKNGLAEAVKYGIIDDSKLFFYIKKNIGKLLNLRSNPLLNVIVSCCRIKARVVSADEKETKGIRSILNFGHTIGHAIETAGSFNQYQHGEAVALGMRVACRISFAVKLLKPSEEILINKLLDDINLPKKIKGLDLNKILNVMRHDKKFIAGKNRFVLAVKIGKVKVVEGIDEKIIKEAIKTYIS